MKKVLTGSFSILLVLSSCGTYEGAGAYTGATFGSIIGSAVGGISGGWRGHEIGKLAGLAGGAIVGAAVGKAADNKLQRQYEGESGYSQRDRAYSQHREDFEPADDVVDFQELRGPARFVPNSIEILHARLVDSSRDGVLTRGESARVVFEIRNVTDKPIFQVQPLVSEMTQNRHIHISQNVLVECIQPRQTIRYTAQVKADNGLRNGQAIIRVGVMQGGKELLDQQHDFTIRTLKH